MGALFYEQETPNRDVHEIIKFSFGSVRDWEKLINTSEPLTYLEKERKRIPPDGVDEHEGLELSQPGKAPSRKRDILVLDASH